MTLIRRLGFSLALIFLLSQWQSDCLAQTTGKQTPSFSQAQAAAGQGAYNEHCADCHGDELVSGRRSS